MEGTDVEALKSATDRLSQAAMKIGEAMYKAQQAQAQQPPPVRRWSRMPAARRRTTRSSTPSSRKSTRKRRHAGFMVGTSAAQS
jgi:hypothetical protein